MPINSSYPRLLKRFDPRLIPLFFMLLLLACPALAQPAPAPAIPQLLIPVACTPGQDCWIVNYVDTDPGPDAADYRCGQQTYNNHQGTDFALRDLAAMNDNIAVLAAAAGIVLRVRDNIDDYLPDEEEREKMLAENRGCGNGLVIDHGDQWQTIYCHLKKNSILVKQGDRVTPGQEIAAIGHSGATQFPHLHFGVFHQSRVIDPFTGNNETASCKAEQNSLFLPGLPLTYQPVSLYAAGFSATIPDFETLQQKARNPDSLPVNAPVLAFWALLYNAAPHDEIALQIRDPQNNIFAERTLTQDKHRARQFYYVGKRNAQPLPPGAYTGTITLTRTQPDGSKITRQLARAIYIQ